MKPAEGGGGLLSSWNWPKKIAAGTLFLLGAGMISFAAYYLIAPRIADLRIHRELASIKNIDQAALISKPLSLTSISPIPFGDKLNFASVDWKALPDSTNELGQRIVIPAIQLDEEVVELDTYTKDGNLNYETPKFAVGHLFDRDNIGSNRDVFLWGHIESPWIHEGKPFKRLSEVADYLKAGQAVDVFVYTSKYVYNYRVVDAYTSTPENVGLGKNSGEPTLKLVSSWPPKGYWDRFVAVTKLIQVAPLTDQEAKNLKSEPSDFKPNGLS